MPSSGCPGLNLRFFFLRLRWRSLLIVAEKTNVRMSGRAGSASTLEWRSADTNSSTNCSSSSLPLWRWSQNLIGVLKGKGRTTCGG